jgi:DNA-binding CsgD family transcriptional regulator
VPHLLSAFYLLGLLAGASSISATFVIWQRHAKRVILRFGLFQVSLFLILLYFSLGQYARLAGLGASAAAADIQWIIMAGGCLMYVIVAPPFYDSLLGLARRRWKTILFLAVDAVAVLAAAADIAMPSGGVIRIGLSALLFAVIGYGLLLIAARLHAVGDPLLRRALLVFLVLSACFFPLMYLDIALSFVPALSFLSFMDNLTLPAYFLVMSCLALVFGLRYLNRPAYSEAGRLTDYFRRAFRVTEREGEIIGLLMEGAGGKRIAEKLFISEKTVENHVYSIYQKLKVRNRVQLFQLLRANSLD